MYVDKYVLILIICFLVEILPFILIFNSTSPHVIDTSTFNGFIAYNALLLTLFFVFSNIVIMRDIILGVSVSSAVIITLVFSLDHFKEWWDHMKHEM